jgi:hypothetical protein
MAHDRERSNTGSCCSKRDVKEFRGAFTMLKPVCKDAERKCLGFGNSFVRRFAIGHHSGKLKYLGQPTAVAFLFVFNCEGHCHF